jgi:membrane protein DedA with SNARE-associated domain
VSDLFLQIERHGYAVIFVIVFAEAIGLPMPAAIALVGGGAAVAAKLLNGPALLALAICGMLLGDTLLFVLGRYMGWTLLGLLCRLSMNPEACILNSAESFYKRGKTTLVIAKFIPGVNTMSPPLAGSMRMRPTQFLRFDLAGALLYILAYGMLGYLGRDFLNKISSGFKTAGHAVTEVLALAFVVYIIYRFLLYYKNREYRVVPRVQVEELARKLAEEGDKVTIVDVRSHGYYDAGVQRIKGSVRIEPNNLEEELKHLSKDKEIYLYCT